MNVLANFHNSPISTVVGILGGAFIAVAQQNPTSWRALGSGLVVALLGILIKEK